MPFLSTYFSMLPRTKLVSSPYRPGGFRILTHTCVSAISLFFRTTVNCEVKQNRRNRNLSVPSFDCSYSSSHQSPHLPLNHHLLYRIGSNENHLGCRTLVNYSNQHHLGITNIFKHF